MPTKQELQQELDAFGIEYGRSATKAELEALLAEVGETVVEEITDETDTAPSSGTATSFEDVTGLCRQCKKPANHLHQGV